MIGWLRNIFGLNNSSLEKNRSLQSARASGVLRRGEAGNIFFTLFGAVALVGVVGVSTSTLMRGPVGTVIKLNQKAKAESEMQIAQRLALLEAVNQADDGDCDTDAVVEPLAPDTSAPAIGLTGGGRLPAGIGATRQDPWGTDYGYCGWDHGTTGTCTGTNLLGNAAGNGIVMAIISAGADRTFQSTCSDDPTYVTKPGTSDDIVLEITYDGAVTATGGLWSLRSDNPDIATIDKSLEVDGAATFTSGGSFAGDLGLSLPGSRLDLSAGALIMLPNEAASGPCNAANRGALRRQTTGGTTQILQICDDLGTGWTDIGGAGASIASGGAGDVQFNDGSGLLAADSAFTYTSASGGTLSTPNLDTNGNADISGTLGVTGATTLSGSLRVDGDITDGGGDVTVADGFVVTGSSTLEAAQINGNITASDGTVNVASNLDVTGQTNTATLQSGAAVLTSTLDARGAISNSTGDIALSDDVDITGAIENPSGNVNVNDAMDVSGFLAAQAFIDINGGSDPEGMFFSSGGDLQLRTANTTRLEIDQSGDIGINLGGPPTQDLDIGGVIRLRRMGAIAGAACGTTHGSITYSSGDELLVCSDLSGNWETIGTSGGGGGGIGGRWDANGSDIYYNLGNVGIGTINPASLLHIYNGSGDARLSVEASGSDTSIVELLTDGTGAFALGSAGTRGWAFMARNAGFAPISEQNDINLSYWDGTAYQRAFTIDSINRNIGLNTQDPTASLLLDAEGNIGAQQYCDANGNFCFLAADVASGTVAAPGANTEILFNSGGVLGSDPSFVFMSTSNRLGLGVTNPAAQIELAEQLLLGTVNDCTAATQGALRLNASGDVLEMCDFAGSGGYVAIGGASVAAPGTDREIVFNSGGALATRNDFVFTSAGNMGIGIASPVSFGSSTGTNLLYIRGDNVNSDAELVLDAGNNSVGSNPLISFANMGTLVGSVRSQRAGTGLIASGLVFATHDGTSVGDRVRITPTGELGVGVVTPRTLLDVDGTIKMAYGGEACDASREGAIHFDSAGNNFFVCRSAGTWERIITAGGGGTPAGGSDREIQFNSGGSLAGDANFVFTSTGRLGIGTNAPDRRLDVESIGGGVIAEFSATTTAADTFSVIDLRAPNSANSRVKFRMQNDSQSWGLGIDGSDADQFKIARNADSTFSNTYFTIDPNGNTGIGFSSADMSTKLSVDGTIKMAYSGEACDANREGAIHFDSAADRFFVCQNAADGWVQIATNNADPGAPDRGVQFNSGGSFAADANFVYDSAGRLGIGTTNPTRMLHVVSNVDGVGTMQSSQRAWLNIITSNDTAGAALTVLQTPSQQWNVGLSAMDGNAWEDDFYIQDVTNGATYPFVLERVTGNLGLGTTSPRTRLDAVGTIKIAYGGEACDAAREGAIRYDSGADTFSFCALAANGWQTITLGSGSLAALGDTNITAPTDGEVLYFSAGAWENRTLNIDDLGDAQAEYALSNSVFMGQGAGGAYGGLDDLNTALGISALSALNNSDADRNVAVGYQALQDNVSGDTLIAIGVNALMDNISGSNAIAIGDNALRFTSAVGTSTIAIGNEAMELATNTRDSVAIGYRALQRSTAGYNVAIGTDNLNNKLDGTGNVAISNSVGETISSGSNNILIGSRIYALGTVGAREDNTVIGARALEGSGLGDANVVVGRFAMTGAGDKNRNTVLGSFSGSNVGTGNDNILVGYDVEPPFTNISNYINIGDIFYGSMGTGELFIGGTGALTLPSGAVATRPGDLAGTTAVNGMIRYNTSNDRFEAYQGGAWQDILTTAIAGGASAPDRGIQFNSGGDFAAASNFVYTSTGRVGIGTATPNVDLSVRGDLGVAITGNTTGSLYVGGFTGGGATAFINLEDYTNNRNWRISHTDSSNDLALLYTDGGTGERLRLTSGGFLGLGTSTPMARVHVYNAGGNGSMLVEGSGGNATSDLNLLTNGDGASTIGMATATGWSLTARNNGFAVEPNVQNDLMLYYWDGSTYRQNFLLEHDTGNLVLTDVNNVVAAAKLDVGGTIKMAYGGEACDVAREGSIRYDSAADAFSFCASNANGWETVSLGAGSLAALSDTNITAPANGQILYFSGSQWENRALNIDDLGDAGTSYSSGSMYLGQGTPFVSVTGNNNTVLGNDAGSNMADASNNTVLGHQAGAGLTDGDENVLIGYRAGSGSIGTSYRNVIIGNYAGENAGLHNVYIGERAGRDGTGTSNTFVGRNAGAQVTSGNSNVILGDQDEASIFTTGSNNTLIGSWVDTPAPDTSNYLNIADVIFGSADTGNLTIGGTAALRLPAGTDAQRPAGAAGMIRFNSTSNVFEGFDGTAWEVLGSDAGGSIAFVSLSDTPASYTGQGGRFARVNSGETAIEFTDQIIESVTGQPAPNAMVLNDLGDVSASATDGQFLQFDSATGQWIAASPSGGSATFLSDADGNTLVQVEESANEDIIRFDVGGTQAMTIYPTYTLPSESVGSGLVVHQPVSNNSQISIRNSSTSTGGNYLTFGHSWGTTSYGFIGTDGDNIHGNHSMQISVGGDRAIQLRTNNSQRMLIQSDGLVRFSSTGAIVLPAGLDAQRPGTPEAGMIRYSSTSDVVEFFNGTIWQSFATSAGAVTTAGNEGDLQFNSGGALGAVSGLNFSVGSGTLSVDSIVNIGGTTGAAAPVGAVPVGGGGASVALNDITDVNTAGFADGEVLMYSAGASAWVPGAVDSSNLTAAGANRQIQFNSNGGGLGAATNFVYTAAGYLGVGTATPAAEVDVAGDVRLSGNLRLGIVSGNAPTFVSSGALALNDLSDVTALTVADGEVLLYSAGASGWVPGTVPTGQGGLWTDGSGDSIYYNSGTPRVGIGLTNPSVELDVSGDIRGNSLFLNGVAGNAPTYISMGSLALGDLTNVNTAGFADGEILMYSAGASAWVPGSVPAGQGGLWTAGSGDTIYYNSGTARVAIGGTSAANELDVTGDIRVSNSVIFTPVGGLSAPVFISAGSSSGGSTTLEALTDTTITSPANGQILAFNGTAWVNQANSGAGLWSDSGSGYIEYSSALGGIRVASVTGAALPSSGAVASAGGGSSLWTAGSGDDIYYNPTTPQVGIGNTTPDVALDVTGDIEYTGTLTDVSDMRLKTDIAPLNAHDIISRLGQVDTYSFRMIGDENGQLELGVMAQEVEKLFPELVRTADDEMGTKSVNYVGFIAPLIEASKELKAENEALRSEIEEMKLAQAEFKDDILREVNGLKAHTGYGINKAQIGLWMIALVIGFSSVLFFAGAIIRQRQRKQA